MRLIFYIPLLNYYQLLYILDKSTYKNIDIKGFIVTFI